MCQATCWVLNADMHRVDLHNEAGIEIKSALGTKKYRGRAFRTAGTEAMLLTKAVLKQQACASDLIAFSGLISLSCAGAPLS